MDANGSNLWNVWHSSPEIQKLAEAWINKPANVWSEEDEELSSLDPDKALATMFAIMQLTDDKSVLGSLGAGQFEGFLGNHGEKYVDVIHTVALQHRQLREVLDFVWQGSMPKQVWHRIEILKRSVFS
jgi:hypothetical protein